MLTQPRISQAVFPGSPKVRLYFIAFEGSYVEVSITNAGDVNMNVNLIAEPPEGVLGEWIEQVSKDAAESFGGSPTQLSDAIVKGLYDQ